MTEAESAPSAPYQRESSLRDRARYLRLRWRADNGRKRMKYIGKVPE
jgi:hypothetical protein